MMQPSPKSLSQAPRCAAENRQSLSDPAERATFVLSGRSSRAVRLRSERMYPGIGRSLRLPRMAVVPALPARDRAEHQRDRVSQADGD